MMLSTSLSLVLLLAADDGLKVVARSDCAQVDATVDEAAGVMGFSEAAVRKEAERTLDAAGVSASRTCPIRVTVSLIGSVDTGNAALAVEVTAATPAAVQGATFPAILHQKSWIGTGPIRALPARARDAVQRLLSDFAEQRRHVRGIESARAQGGQPPAAREDPPPPPEPAAEPAVEKVADVAAAEEPAARIPRYEAIVAAEPKNREAWVALGNDYYDTQQPQKSIDAYARALALKAADANVLCDQGNMYDVLGQVEKAIANYRRALKYEANHLKARINLGVALARKPAGVKEAVQLWKKVVQLAPESEEAGMARAAIAEHEAAAPPQK